MMRIARRKRYVELRSLGFRGEFVGWAADGSCLERSAGGVITRVAGRGKSSEGRVLREES
jgi:hypothetical protein